MFRPHTYIYKNKKILIIIIIIKRNAGGGIGRLLANSSTPMSSVPQHIPRISMTWSAPLDKMALLPCVFDSANGGGAKELDPEMTSERPTECS